MKRCSNCKKDKTRLSFSGKSPWCKSCVNVYNKKYYRLNREYMDECHRKWVEEHQDRWLEIKRIGRKRYATIHPEIVKAQQKAHWLREKLIKNKCEVCGKKEDLELHHPDYSKPLYVVTLCKECHRKETYNWI